MKFKLGMVLVAVLFLCSQSNADTKYTEELNMIKASQSVESTVKVSYGVNHGTGFFISENEVLTNYHVIKNGIGTITNYDKRTCTATLKYQEDGIDLALLTTNCRGTPLGLTEIYTVGQTVLAIGNPDIYSNMVTKGVVSGEGWQHILFDATIAQGSSGGPLVNIEGKVIGVVRAQDKYTPIGYAITAKEVNRFLERAR